MSPPADGNALVKAQVQTGGAVGAFVPQTFDEAWRIAGALATSGITPFKRQEEVLAVMMAGAEIGLTPFASTQSFALINGRVAIWGDGMLGVVRARGVKVKEWTTGTIAGGDFEAHCTVTRPDTGEEIERSFSMVDAKRAGLAGKQGPWTQYPQRMAPMRARSWALRDGCADILRGIKMVEEMQDVAPVEARVVDSTGDNDQRPQDERVGKHGVIGGQAGKDAFDALAENLSNAKDAHLLEIEWAAAENSNLSANRMFALAEHYEACKDALENFAEPPAPPKFAKEAEPSPFSALKAAGDAVATLDHLNAWVATLTPDALGKCTDVERVDLRSLYAAKKSNPAGVAGTGEGAGKAEPYGGAGKSAGAAAPSASSSPFESTKQSGLALLELTGVRRRRDAYTQWLETVCIEKPKCSPLEQAELDRLQENIGKEVGA